MRNFVITLLASLLLAGSASAQTLPDQLPGSDHPLSAAAFAEVARDAAAQGQERSMRGGVREGVFWTSVGLIGSGVTLLAVDQFKWFWNGCGGDPNDPNWQWLKELPPSTPPPGGWPPNYCDSGRTMKTAGASLAVGGVAVWIAGKIHASVVHPQIVWTPGGATFRGRVSF